MTLADMIRAAVRRLPKPEQVDKSARAGLAAAIDMLETCATDAEAKADPVGDAAEAAAVIDSALGDSEDGFIRIPFAEAASWQSRLEAAVAAAEGRRQ